MPTDVDIAHRMRWLMSLDEPEFELARMIEEENELLNADPELLQEAFTHLTSSERRCWKDWLEYRGKYERQQQ